MSTPPADLPREIRVFVSSTFRDMHAERDHLVKMVFPQLKALCESKNVALHEIDLRWGITDEQTAEGKTLAVCLDEIDRCRPFFIGLVADRYGWIPASIPPTILDRRPWLTDHVGRSVTDIEIHYGALQDDKSPRHAYFYFRAPQSAPTALDAGEVVAESGDFPTLLADLKRRIRDAAAASTVSLREGYENVEQLGAWILDDFTRLIHRLFPADSKPNEFEQRRLRHEAAAAVGMPAYVRRSQAFDQLDGHLRGGDLPLVVTGPSGIGKTALIKQWYRNIGGGGSDVFRLIHIVGVEPSSSDVTQLQRRIMHAIKKWFDLPAPVPDTAEDVAMTLPRWLAGAAKVGRLLIVVDGIDRLRGREQLQHVDWLPDPLPPEIRVVLSTRDGGCLEACWRRGYAELNVTALIEAERREMIVQFFRAYGKTLPETSVDQIVGADATSNPRFLATLLDELRQFGDHERLQGRLDWYLQSGDLKSLFLKVVQRWQEDFAGGTNLVGDCLSLIRASRFGLSEQELLDCLAIDGERLPLARWTPLRLAMGSHLIELDGLMSIADEELDAAIRDTLPASTGERDTIPTRLRNYFSSQPPTSPRTLDEFPHLLATTGDWRALVEFLSSFKVFQAMRGEPQRDAYLKDLCVQLAEHGQSFASTYLDHLNEYLDSLNKRARRNRLGEFKQLSWALIFFLLEIEQHPEACVMIRARAKNVAELENATYAGIIATLAATHTGNRQYKEAADLLRHGLWIDKQTKKHADIETACLECNFAEVLCRVGRYAEAETRFRSAMPILEEHVQTAFQDYVKGVNNFGWLLGAIGRLEDSLQFLGRAIATCESKLGSRRPETAVCIQNRAGMLFQLGRHSEAEADYKQALSIFQDTQGMDNVYCAAILGSLSMLYASTSRIGDAEKAAKDARSIMERTKKEPSRYAMILGTLGYVLREQGKLTEAKQVLSKAIAIMKKHGTLRQPTGAKFFQNLALVQHATGESDNAESSFRQTLDVLRETIDPQLAIVQGNFAKLLYDEGRLREAEIFSRQAAESVLRYPAISGNDHPQKALVLESYEKLLRELGLGDEAVKLKLDSLARPNRYESAGDIAIASTNQTATID